MANECVMLREPKMLKSDRAKCVSLALLAFLWLAPLPAVHAAELRVPNASLEVTVKQKQDEKFGEGLHLLHLLCWDGQCALTTLSLNQCGPAGSGKPAFFPKVQRTSTSGGDLTVRNVGNVLEAQQTITDIGGDSTAVLRFTYGMSSSRAMANRVIAFTGGYIKNSTILKRVTTVEYVPLIGAFNEIVLDCAALLPGVDTQR
jgi:hypothetical protein